MTINTIFSNHLISSKAFLLVELFEHGESLLSEVMMCYQLIWQSPSTEQCLSLQTGNKQVANEPVYMVYVHTCVY
jgi:hypothetical protein